jgi:hypothetical protein
VGWQNSNTPVHLVRLLLTPGQGRQGGWRRANEEWLGTVTIPLQPPQGMGGDEGSRGEDRTVGGYRGGGKQQHP